MNLIPECDQDIMTEERKEYLRDEISEHVHIGTKLYEKHPTRGNINLREFTCFQPADIQYLNTEQRQLKEIVETNPLLPSVIRSMQRDSLIREILSRSRNYAEENLKDKKKFKVEDLRNILLDNYAKAASSRKRKKQ